MRGIAKRGRFLLDAASTGVAPHWRRLGWLEGHFARALMVKAAISALAGWLASLFGRPEDLPVQWIIAGAVFLIVFLLLLLNGSFVQAQRYCDPAVYSSSLSLERATPISGGGVVGVEIEFMNRTGYPVSLHVQRDRVLYDGTLAPAQVDATRHVANNQRGVVRVVFQINRSAPSGSIVRRIAQDYDAGEVKGIDVENLDVMARLADDSRIVADVSLPMPGRQAYTLTLSEGVWRLGRIQYVAGVSA